MEQEIDFPPYPMEEYIKNLQEQLTKQINDSIKEEYLKKRNITDNHYLSYKLPLTELPTIGNYNLTSIQDYDKTLNGLYGYYGVPLLYKSPSQFLVTTFQINSLEDVKKEKRRKIDSSSVSF